MLITHPTKHSIQDAIKFAFKHLPQDEMLLRQQLIMNLIDSGFIEMEGCFVGVEGELVVGVLISQLRPDGLVMIWHPATLDNFSIQSFFSPLDKYAKSRNAPAIILMVDNNQIVEEITFFDNGFSYVSDMLFLFSNVSESNKQLADELLTKKNNPQLKFIPVTEAIDKGEKNYRARLIELMRDTYINTKDFPKLLDLIPVDKILDEYQRNKFFRSELWFFVQKLHESNNDNNNNNNNRDIGVLLLTDSPSDCLELTYMGLVEGERGKGYSQEIIKFAQKTAVELGRKFVTTVVDEQNSIALRSYLKEGFIAWDRKKIYAKIF
ncbi:MAG: GNAT family N-acetyltransferase [Planctomycetaceae bacterium]|nr:GNAT family N-acetyltransferase [Planctomycetaceae bacterium]